MTVCLGGEEVTQHCKVLDTDAFDIVIGTDFLRFNPQVKLLSLQRPYALHCDFGSGLYSVPLELSGLKESGLRYVNRSYRTGKHQLVRPVLENGLAALQLDLNEIQVELFASKEQHLMQLYCSRNLNNAYCLYWKSMGLCYANPPFSQLAKVITKITLEGAKVVLCTLDWGTTGEHAYWRRLLDRMTVGGAAAGASGRHNEPGSRPASTCPAQPASKAGGDSPRVGGRHHGDRKADRSTESDRTGRGAAHQRGAMRHAREARRRPQPRHKDRCQATTATGCREPGKRAQHTTNRGTGQGAKDSRAPTPAHRTHGQREAGPGRTPESTSGRGWESARPRTPHTQARGAPPRAPSNRPHSAQSQLARARAVRTVS